MANPKSPQSGGSGWRGRADDESAEIQHRWQTAETAVAADRPVDAAPTDGRGRRIAFGVLLVAALVLLGVYVRSLLLAPVQTPVLILSADEYPAPFAANAWSREDAAGLGELHGETLNVASAKSVEQFDAQLKSLLAGQKRSQVVVVVLSMHGAVNQDGEACLIPPTASATESGTWVKLSSVLDKIRVNVPDKTRKLLILDCNRVRTWFPQGTLHNTFADRLPDALQKSGVENLVVLNSASPGERGWAAGELRGSVFGHFLRRGIAGKADANGDRSVSLKELVQYVTSNVNRYARHHFAESQRPKLLSGTTGGSADDVDFHVAWAFKGTLPEANPFTPAVKSADIAALWSYQAPAVADATYRFDPLTWSEFQQKLLRLEATNAAGEAYSSQSTNLYNELVNVKARIDQQRSAVKNKGSLLADLKIFSRDTEGLARVGILPDLALSQLLGGIDSKSAARIQAAWKKAETAPTAENISNALQAIDALPLKSRFADVFFLRMLKRYQVDALWPKAATLTHAMALRRDASRAAVPEDPRTFRAVDAALASADRGRRLVEDRILVGDQSAESEMKALADEYQAAANRTDSLAAALQLRDRVHVELPWLLAWLSIREVSVTDREKTDLLVRKVIGSFRQFRHELRSDKPGAARKTEVEQQLAELRKEYDDECAKLSREKNADAAVLRRLRAVLSVPLVTGRVERAVLTDLSREMAEKIHRQYPDDPATKPANGGDQVGLNVAVPPKSYPLLRLFEDSSPQAGDNADAAASHEPYQNEADLRRRMKTLRGEIDNLAQNTSADPATYRRNAAWVADRWRLALALPMPRSERDPVHFLRRFDLRQMLVWQAERAQRDFWGNLGSENDPAFFAHAADRYLEVAGRVFAHPIGKDNRPQQITATLNRWRKSPIFETFAMPGVSLDATDNVTIDVTVKQPQGIPADGENIAGIAGVSLWGPATRLGTTVKSLDVKRADAGPGTTALVFSVNPSLIQGAQNSLSARTIFRGHELVGTFRSRNADGTTSEVEPTTATESRVTVLGSAAKPMSIVLIFDCSYSMNNLVQGSGSRMTRHQAALKALKSLLGKLAERGNARVGVVFYGHRVAWNASKPTELLRQTEYARRFSDALLPLEDVEAVLPLGRFDDRVSKQIDRLLATVKPWGETPLYLAIDEALRQFAGETGDGEQRIVVITDGVNNQRVPTDLELTKSQSAKVMSRADLERAIRRQSVPIHILGFEMDSAEERGAQDDFRKIATQSKGTYLPAVSGEKLLGTLTGLLGPADFRLQSPDNKPLGEAALGKTITVTVPAPLSATVKAGGASSRIDLHGGESLQLNLSGDGTSLRTDRYTNLDPIFVPLVDPALSADSGISVGLHAATRVRGHEGTVEFTISLQRDDLGVASRPPLVWIEITPTTAQGARAGDPYYVVDAAYALRKPVPVMVMRAVNWPATARRASIRVWCQKQSVKPDAEVAVSRLTSGIAKSGTPGKVSAEPLRIAGTTLLADVKQNDKLLVLRVFQRVAVKGNQLKPLKIDVSGVPAKRIVRTFDVKHGIALHRFEFDRARAEELAAASLHITGSDTAQTGALFSKATSIEVRPNVETLPLTVRPLGTKK